MARFAKKASTSYKKRMLEGQLKRLNHREKKQYLRNLAPEDRALLKLK